MVEYNFGQTYSSRKALAVLCDVERRQKGPETWTCKIVFNHGLHVYQTWLWPILIIFRAACITTLYKAYKAQCYLYFKEYAIQCSSHIWQYNIIGFGISTLKNLPTWDHVNQKNRNRVYTYRKTEKYKHIISEKRILNLQ